MDATNTMSPMPAVPALTYNGQFTHGVDEQRRVKIPSRWRPESGEAQWIAVLWPKSEMQGHFLVVLTQERHNKLMQDLHKSSIANRTAMGVVRFFSRNSADLVMDKAGRVMLPEHLATPAGIKENAILVGMWDRFEIWSPENHKQTAAQEDAVVPLELEKYL